MKSLIFKLLKLIPLKKAIEIILEYLTEQAKKSPADWDDKAMEYLWLIYQLLKGYIPDTVKTAMSRRLPDDIG